MMQLTKPLDIFRPRQQNFRVGFTMMASIFMYFFGLLLHVKTNMKSKEWMSSSTKLQVINLSTKSFDVWFFKFRSTYISKKSPRDINNLEKLCQISHVRFVVDGFSKYSWIVCKCCTISENRLPARPRYNLPDAFNYGNIVWVSGTKLPTAS